MQRVLCRGFATSSRSASHVGSLPIPFPSSVTITPLDGVLSVKGPKGSAAVPLASFVRLETRPIVPRIPSGEPSTSSLTSASSNSPPSPSSSTLPHELVVSVLDPTIKQQRATWGLSRSLISNAITGLTEGFAVPIRIVGVGFKAELHDNPAPLPGFSAKRIFLKVNRAHPVWVNVPEGIEATVPYPTKIVLWGTDKQKLGQLGAEIRRWRKPEPYKGKGIFVGDETIKIKDVKKK